MKKLIYLSITLALVCGILSPATLKADGFSIPTQWEAEKVYVFQDEIALTGAPSKVENDHGSAAGNIEGMTKSTTLVSAVSILTASPLHLILFAPSANASVGFTGRRINSSLLDIATVFERISIAVKVELLNSGIMHKYFRFK